MTVLYGIPNCASVKKARAWLDGRHTAYRFNDFKKSPPDAALIESWLEQLPLDTLLNRRGTTWRKLPPEQQAACAQTAEAVALMAAQPSLIKRPVLVHQGKVYCGFDADLYRQLFQAA